LPHWQVAEGRYFATIHLHGSIPAEGRQRIRQLGEQFRSANAKLTEEKNHALELSRKIFAEMEKWLDRLTPLHHLQQPEFAEMVTEAIQRRRDRRNWEMFAYVVMPGQIHLFFEMNGELSLKCELEEFKRWTGHCAAKMDKQFQGRRFWQTEWFDHWSRSDEEDEQIARYIRRNPVKAGLVEHLEEWPNSYSCLQ
jgi:REP element-mobilizing transposase RayT